MPSEGVRTVIHGVKEIRAALDKIDARAEVATVAGLKAMQNNAKRNIKSRMRGRARWDRRGDSQRTGVAVDLNLSPHHVNRAGGPGKLTGSLARGVGGIRRPKKRGPEWVGGVGVGGQVTNLYKRQVEGAFPYIAPGVKRTVEQAPEIWAKAWGKAINR